MEEIKKLIDGNPDILIKKMGDLGVDFNNFSENIARDMVKNLFSSLTDEQFKTVDFVFWISYFVERVAEKLIIDSETQSGARKVAIETLVSKLHFGEKIKVIEELYIEKKDNFIKLMREVQDLRNDIAHGKFDNLKYGGYSLSDNRGKIKLIAHLRDVYSKRINFS
jgi:sulfur relay (sulfurtransferase) DsrC/TusE family protein